MEDGDGGKFDGGNIPNFAVKMTHEAKLRELLRNITSVELELCSNASKEFMKLLRGDDGGEFLREYVRMSFKLAEFLQAWKLRQGKQGLSYVLSLISAILSHPDGKCRQNDAESVGISRNLDKFARSIIEEKLNDIYKELNSKESRRQNAALLLLASIVRRGSGLASDVAKSFDFKLPVFIKLAKYTKKRVGEKRKRATAEVGSAMGVKSKRRTRDAFVGFAMSFLEVGKPGLFRWILQQREMYSGVLCGLGYDDDDTVVYVLSTLRDRILTPDSLVPPGLRSVLFGSVTLNQLIGISGRENDGPAAEMAHSVLIMVCTDPSNGLMPDLAKHPVPFRGNPKRLLNVMKKLKATEINYHRELLLAIVNGRPAFASTYLENFPYNLEDHASPMWFPAVSLAANLVSSVGTGEPFGFLKYQPHDQASLSSPDVQNIIKCICPRPFTRSIINKGLLHSDSLVKHGTLRLVMEEIKLLDSFLCALTSYANQLRPRWESLKQDILNEVRILLPDPQVLLSLLSSLHSCKSPVLCSKRAADSEVVLEHEVKESKKLKTRSAKDDTDIVVGGIGLTPEIILPGDGEEVLGTHNGDDLDDGDDHAKLLAELWGWQQLSMPSLSLKDEETYFYSKLLDTLKIYQRTMPTALEGSFDFFKALPSNPLSLPSNLQQSFLSLLIEKIGWSPKGETSIRTQPQMYKHLDQFINLLIYSPLRDIKNQAHVLAQAAMLSAGAFDKNPREIGAWFLFLPGITAENILIEDQGFGMLQNLGSSVVSFLADVVSTTGNNLFKYWGLLRRHIYHAEGAEELSPDFSPLVVCALEKCLRLLSSETGSFTIAEKSVISLYVSNTLKYLLQTQVEAGLLSSVIFLLLSEKFEDSCTGADASGDLCEWRPLRNLFFFSKSIRTQKTIHLSIDREVVESQYSFNETLHEIKRVMGSGDDVELVGIATAFSLSMLCTSSAEIVQNFPTVISISVNLNRVPLSLLLSVFFSEPSLLYDVSKLWPEIFFPSLESFVALGQGDGRSEEVIRDEDLNSMQSITIAFAEFLKQAPFYVLFPAIMSCGGSHLLPHVKFQDLLLDKLTGGTTDQLVLSFRLVLFWLSQILSSYKVNPSNELEKLSEICFILMEHLVAQLIVERIDSGCLTCVLVPFSTVIQDVIELIVSHPAVLSSLVSPLHCNCGLTDAIFTESLGTYLGLAGQVVHKMDHHVFNLLKMTSERLLAFIIGQKDIPEVDCGNKQIVAFRALVQKILLMFREKFKGCIRNKELLPLTPTLYALHTLIHLISPIELLELFQWLLSQIDLNDSADWSSFQRSAISVGLQITGCAFDMFSTYMQRPYSEQKAFAIMWGVDWKSVEVNILERIYFQVFEIATHFELDAADQCLLKAVNIANSREVIQDQFLPLCMEVPRAIANTPVTILSHCTKRISKTKAKLLFLLTEISPLHLSIFGHWFYEMINNPSLTKGSARQTAGGYSISDKGFVLLLPSALTYLNSAARKFGGQIPECFKSIFSFYWKVLFDGFSNWKTYISTDLFEVELGKYLPSSLEELLNFFHGNLLGKAILMLQHFFALSRRSVKLKKRLKLFNSICPHSGAHGDLFDSDTPHIHVCIPEQSLNFINRIIAKVYLCKLLSFPVEGQTYSILKDEGQGKEVTSDVGSSDERLMRTRFLNMLVQTWIMIVKRFPLKSKNSRKVEDMIGSLYRHLEVFIMNNIVEVVADMCCFLITLQSLPFIDQLARFTLLHRFDDPATLRMLRRVLTSLREGKFPCTLVLQLLLAHSQFASTIYPQSKLSASSQFGVIFKPMSSILRSFSVHYADQKAIDRKSVQQISEEYGKQVEVVKLLRMLFQIVNQHCGFNSENEMGIDTKELLFLLLSSYGGTLSEIDVEIYKLMLEIESTEKSKAGSLAEMDYLWGSAAVRIVEEQRMEHGPFSDNGNETESIEERKRIQFRENLPLDPKLCANTVLYFPYDRTVGESSGNLQQNNSECILEEHTISIEKKWIYDPAFILRFSIHSLSTGYIEPLEFASLGLLAVAFVSISSLDEDMRKLGYEVLGRFKSTLEQCPKRKEVMRLRLLLTYLQNGIEEPWQRIPSLTAIFIAEASFILLDPLHDHYSTISKLLMRSPSVKMKGIPLFHNFFWSNSINFRTDRLWILRLLCVGLNMDDDAQIFIRNSILETLISFYVSPLSDEESKELILQIIKKSVKLPKMARYLVERCGLISWLSSIVSSLPERQYQDYSLSSYRLNLVVEVVNDIISPRNTNEWLQKYALEQLTELASDLHKILVMRSQQIAEKVSCILSILQILISTMKISQKRKVYQPHFTLSTEALFKLCNAVGSCTNGKHSLSAEFGLKAVLMSTPPIDIFSMDQGMLSRFINWAVSTARLSISGKDHQPKEAYNHFIVSSELGTSEDSLLSKLLRWLTAAVILGMLSVKFNGLNSSCVHEKRSKLETLQSLLEHNEAGCQRNLPRSGSEYVLAAAIFYIQQVLGMDCRTLPSVVSALSLLCYSSPSIAESSVQHDHGISLVSLFSSIRCPPEAIPVWRWSFYQPWRDIASETTDAEKLDELQACQTLLVGISNTLGQKSVHPQFLSCEDMDNSGVFKWERSILVSD